jgi:uncharacterized protein YndB with AHSA1/START domain
MEINGKSGANSQAKPVVITRYFDLPVSTLWKAWTDPETLKKWWGPKDFTCPFAKLDVKVGGRNLTCMKDASGKEFWGTGTYKEVIPNKKLVVTDHFSDSKGNIINAKEQGLKGDWPDELLITVEFGESEGKSSLWLRHEGIPAEAFDDCVSGWQECFDKLEEKVS